MHGAATEVQTFTVVLEVADNGGLVARVASLPEIVVRGNDEHEALIAAEDAIRSAINA